MDKLDLLLKEKANNEKEYIPVSLDKKINDALSNLPMKKSKKALIAASLATALIGAPLLSIHSEDILAKATDIPIIKHAVEYFSKNDDSYYIGEKDTYETYAQPVGISEENNGVKVTIKEVYCDDNYISVFYTAEGGKNNILRKNSLKQNSNLHSAVDIDFHGIVPSPGVYLEEKVDESGNIQGVYRKNITQSTISKSFKLKVNFKTAYDIEGDWNFEFYVVKDNVSNSTKIYKPNVSAKINNGSVHDITIDKVVISPSGNHIAISEKDWKSQIPALRFVVYDDKDNMLGALCDEGISGLENSYKFPLIKDDTKSLKLVPIIPETQRRNGGHYFYDLVTINENLPKKIKAPNLGSVVINKIISTADRTEVYFQKENLYKDPYLQIIDGSEVIKYQKPVLVDSGHNIYKQVLTGSNKNSKLLVKPEYETDFVNVPKEIPVSDKGSIKITNIEKTEKDTRVYYEKLGIVTSQVYMAMINPKGEIVDIDCDDQERLIDKDNGTYMQIFPKCEDNYRLTIGDEERTTIDDSQAIIVPLK